MSESIAGTIAFLGLGAMGFGMATNLLAHSLSITGYDIYPPTLTRFVEAGGLSSSTPRAAVQSSKYIIFMVATASQINEAIFSPETGAIETLEKGAVIILCSTGPPSYTLEIETELLKRGRTDIFLVDAPVSGGTLRAANGTLTILSSGSERALQVAKPILELLAGPNLWSIPGGLGAGTKVKMVHQVLAGINILMASEAMAFAAVLGVDTRKAYEYLKAGEGTSWMFENRGINMLSKQEKVNSALGIIVKDVGIITSSTITSNFPLFILSTTEQILASAISIGYTQLDDSQITRLYLPSTPDLITSLATPSQNLPLTLTPTELSKLKLVEATMKAVHLVSSFEAMSLAAFEGLDLFQLYDIIKGAAGGSFMFSQRIGELVSAVEDTEERTINDVIEDLTKALTEAQRLKFPLHLGGATLQVLRLAKMRGWGKQRDIAVVKIWNDDLFLRGAKR